MKDAAYFRAQAERCLILAGRAERPDVREALLALAHDYESEARAIEARTDAPPTSSPSCQLLHGSTRWMLRSQFIDLREEYMPDSSRTYAGGGAGRASTEPRAVGPNVGRWLDRQANMLQTVEALTHGWFERRRQAIEALWESWAEMRDSRSLEDILRIQHGFLTTSLRRVGSDVEAWTALTGTLWQRVMLPYSEAFSAAEKVRSASQAAMLGTAGSKPRRGRPPRSAQRSTGSNRPPAAAAAK